MPSKLARPSREIPRFVLYGEENRGDGAEAVHVELIETRSRLYDWHIGTHIHHGLFQVLFLFDGTVSASIGDDVWE